MPHACCYFCKYSCPHQIIPGLGKVKAVTASKESSFFLYDDGSAQSCGKNDEGQLGDGSFIMSSAEAPIVNVLIPDSDFIERIGSGPSSQSAFFIGKESVYATGLNDRFQLGIGNIDSQNVPTKVLFDGPVDITYVSASGSHTVANGFVL
jgi:alpha-tubulin suppressor-like RCC1 family protein